MGGTYLVVDASPTSELERAHDLLDEDRPGEALSALDALLGSEKALDAGTRARACGLAGVAAHAIGSIEHARARFREAVAIFETIEAETLALADALEDWAELELHVRAADSARALLSRVIDLRQSAGAEVTAETWLAAADADHAAGDLDSARGHAERAIEQAERDGDRAYAALAREMCADLRLASGDVDLVDTAERAYGDALERWREEGDHDACARCWLGRARCADLRDDEDAMRAALEAGWALPLSAEARAELQEQASVLGVSLEHTNVNEP
jgi:tetratricopeptide (TPR) repeat protein